MVILEFFVHIFCDLKYELWLTTWVKKPIKALSIEKINWESLFKIRHLPGGWIWMLTLCCVDMGWSQLGQHFGTQGYKLLLSRVWWFLSCPFLPCQTSALEIWPVRLFVLSAGNMSQATSHQLFLKTVVVSWFQPCFLYLTMIRQWLFCLALALEPCILLLSGFLNKM